MTTKERILAAVRGETPDRLPWVPRLDFWFRGNLYQQTLPPELRSLRLPEIAQQLGAGQYATVPDFTDCAGEFDMVDRALGIFRLDVLPYQTTLEGVERRVTRRDHETVVEYRTPVGSVSTRCIFTETMLEAGASLSYTTDFAIRQPRDLETVGYIFTHLKVEAQLQGYAAWREQVGDSGVAVAFVSLAACPMHHIMKELMPIEQFFYAVHDYPGAVARLAEQMKPFYQSIQQFAAASPAEIVLLGANYDESVTYPPFYREHILPALRDYAAVLHARGKFLMTHTDGESRHLLPLFLESGFDIADSVCPHPMTSVRLEEFLDAFAERITIWGGIPSTLLSPASATEAEFRSYIDQLLSRYAHQERFILGVSDMVTTDADWDRLRYISEKLL